jgi:large subunit ribosomal protein L21
MFAVIRTGGKQYKVAPADVIAVEKLKAEAGDVIEFADVLMVGGGDGAAEIGAPLVAGATVAAEVVKQARAKKIFVFKKKRRHTYRRRAGHRQDLTLIKITEILTGGKKPSKAKAAAKKTEAKAEPKAEAAETAVVKDDLKLIGGVGPALEKKLQDLGYTSLAQIAALTPEQVAEIDEKLNFKGRVEREDWIGQAKDLLAGRPPRAKSDREGNE